MNDIYHRLSAATSPVQAARVYNPLRSEYYLKDETPKPKASLGTTSAEAGVRVALSPEAKAMLAT